MPEPSLSLSSLLAFALLFGIKHGFDADHLASIDGLARLQTRQGHPRLARLCGMLFSSGHGLVVLVAAWVLETWGSGRLPRWLDPLGAWISIVFLLSIGIVNMRSAWHPDAQRAGSTVSPMAAWIMHLPLPHGFAGSLLVGALFALSFDAMAVAAWFGLAGDSHGGMSATLTLALSFVLGMVLTDTINGLLVAHLISRSASFVRKAGRFFSLLLAGSALLVAAFEGAKLSSELIDAWADGKELLTGAAIFVTIIVGYLVARGMHRAHFSAVVDDHVCGAD